MWTKKPVLYGSTVAPSSIKQQYLWKGGSGHNPLNIWFCDHMPLSPTTHSAQEGGWLERGHVYANGWSRCSRRRWKLGGRGKVLHPKCCLNPKPLDATCYPASPCTCGHFYESWGSGQISMHDGGGVTLWGKCTMRKDLQCRKKSYY